MKFARILFRIAGVWGFLVVTPLYFISGVVAKMDPGYVTQPAFYYGFTGVALAWQIAFFIIAGDPVRFRPIMIPSILEKVLYAGAVVILVLQGRIAQSNLIFGIADLVFAALFLLAYLRTA